MFVVVHERRTGASVTTQYGLLHYDYLICRTGPFIFLFYLLNLATSL